MHIHISEETCNQKQKSTVKYLTKFNDNVLNIKSTDYKIKLSQKFGRWKLYQTGHQSNTGSVVDLTPRCQMMSALMHSDRLGYMGLGMKSWRTKNVRLLETMCWSGPTALRLLPPPLCVHAGRIMILPL